MRYGIIFFFITLFFVSITSASSTIAYDIEEGIRAVKDQQLEKAHDIFLHLAKDDCVDAMWLLGMMYYRGIGVPEDAVMAFQWFENASGLGDPDSMNLVGLMYESGIGISRNLDQAMAWYEKAVENGSVDAMYNLCILNLKLKNNTASYMWYKLAEYYQYDCSEDEKKIIRDRFRSFLDKEQELAVQAHVELWIQKHSGYNDLIKRLSETGPMCYPSMTEAETSVKPSPNKK